MESGLQKIAVVILNWNGRALLEKFLPEVITHSGQAAIYVADNASSDDSVAYLKANFPQVKIILNADNFGFAKGYNLALKQVSEPYLVLLNSDVKVTEDWLLPILNEFESNSETVAIQPKIRSYKNPEYFEYAGAAGGFIDKYAFPYCRGRLFSTLEKDENQYSDYESIFWASGACLAIRAKDFLAIGGFDEDYFAHQEEIDLCWRLFNEQKSIKYVGTSVVYHVGGATLNEGSPKKTFLNFRNSILTLLKNHPKKGLFPVVFTRLCLDGLAGVFLLLQGKPSHCWAIVKSHFAVYAQLKRTLKKRGKNQRSDYYKTPSIVFDYYLKNKRAFFEL